MESSIDINRVIWKKKEDDMDRKWLVWKRETHLARNPDMGGQEHLKGLSYQYNIKAHLWRTMKECEIIQDRKEWWAFVSAIMNLLPATIYSVVLRYDTSSFRTWSPTFRLNVFTSIFTAEITYDGWDSSFFNTLMVITCQVAQFCTPEHCDVISIGSG